MINREYLPHQELLMKLPELVLQKGVVLQNNRNRISKVETDHGVFVVKDFAGMYFLNRLQYSFLRKSKAIRSYTNSVKLNAMGIATPVPVAWIDYYSRGLLLKSYFISLYYPYQTLNQYIKTLDNNGPEITKLYHRLAAFALKLHRAGVLHDDFSIGNIFVIPKDEGFDFGLIDLNRMRFGKVTHTQALSNLKKIQLSPDDQDILIGSYAELSGMSPAKTIQTYHEIRNRASALRTLRKKIRRHTIGYVERLITHE